MMVENTRTSASRDISTDLFVIVTGLQKELLVEQIRSCYLNVGGVLRMKVYSTSSQQNIAILELDNAETLMRASCRRVQVGDYQSQAIYAYRKPLSVINQLIRKKTKLKLQYELRRDQDSKEYKDRLLQFLAQSGGFFNVKKCKCTENRGEITLSVEPSFSLSNLSCNSHISFEQTSVYFSYVIDPLDDAVLPEILIPNHLTMCAQELSKGANLNFAISYLYHNEIKSQHQHESRPSEKKACYESAIEIANWDSTLAPVDHLDEIFEENEDPQPRAMQLTSQSSKSVFYFSEEQNCAFLERFGKQLPGLNPLTANMPGGGQEKYRFPSESIGNQQAERLQQWSEKNSLPQQPSCLVVPVELKVVEILHRLIELTATSSPLTVALLAKEVYSSIAGKIDPDTPAHQMLRVTLKILKTKYRKVKRRERKRVSRDCDAQDESVDDEPLGGGAKADGHPLVCEVVSRLNGSGETGYTFGSEELWRVLQSCDPDWRDFIWKYRTVQDFLEFVPEFGSVETTLKMKVSPQSSQLHNLQSSSPTPAKIPQNSKLVSEQSEIYETQFYGTGFEAFGTHNHNNARIEGTTSVQFVNPHAPKQPTPHRHASVYSPFCDRFRVATKINLPISLRNKVCSIEGKTTPSSPSQEASRSTCKPHAQAELPTATASGEDRWTVHHIESNLRFNRMVTPMLWR